MNKKAKKTLCLCLALLLMGSLNLAPNTQAESKPKATAPSIEHTQETKENEVTSAEKTEDKENKAEESTEKSKQAEDKVAESPKNAIDPLNIVDYSQAMQFTQGDETFSFNQKEGKWQYESPSLKVNIQRFNDTKLKVIYYIADVQFDDTQKLKHFFATPENPGKWFAHPEKIARDNKAVFAINDDQAGYRTYNRKIVGHVVMDGKIVGNSTYKKPVKSLPNLDCMAVADDGTIAVFDANEHTAEDYLAMGYKNVAAFGPWIIKNGEINPFLDRNYTLQEARCAIGMVNKNHYVVFTCEGRRKGITLGASLKWVGEKLKSYGCTEAFNLDGGGTTSLLFMGLKLNSFNPTGELRKERALTGIFALGESNFVPQHRGGK